MDYKIVSIKEEDDVKTVVYRVYGGAVQVVQEKDDETDEVISEERFVRGEIIDTRRVRLPIDVDIDRFIKEQHG
jgi:hypothetical protein